jgi:hypothetical protein
VSSRERIKRQKKEEKQRKQIEMELRSIPAQELQAAFPQLEERAVQDIETHISEGSRSPASAGLL